jgi:hypothetical protein
MMQIKINMTAIAIKKIIIKINMTAIAIITIIKTKTIN